MFATVAVAYRYCCMSVFASMVFACVVVALRAVCLLFASVAWHVVIVLHAFMFAGVFVACVVFTLCVCVSVCCVCTLYGVAIENAAI